MIDGGAHATDVGAGDTWCAPLVDVFFFFCSVTVVLKSTPTQQPPRVSRSNVHVTIFIELGWK